MTTDQEEPLAGERLLEAARNQREFEQRRVADPNFAHQPRWAPHRPWRATPFDTVMTGLGVVILVVVIVIWWFF